MYFLGDFDPESTMSLIDFALGDFHPGMAIDIIIIRGEEHSKMADSLFKFILKSFILELPLALLGISRREHPKLIRSLFNFDPSIFCGLARGLPF